MPRISNASTIRVEDISTDEGATVSATELIELCLILYEDVKTMPDGEIQRPPVFIAGPSGCGKTETVQYGLRAKMAEKYGQCGMAYFDLGGKDTTIMAGYEMPVDGMTKLFPREELPREDRDGAVGILLIDDSTNAPVLTQTVFQDFVRTRRMGSYKLPDGWIIIGTGNRRIDGCAVTDMKISNGRRWHQYVMRPDPNVFIDYAIEQGFHPYVVGYIRAYPERLYVYDPKSTEWTCPMPANWEWVSRSLFLNIRKELWYAHFAGRLGKSQARAFVGWCEIIDQVVDPSVIYADPAAAPLSEDPNVTFTTVMVLSRAATVTNIGATVTYFDRLAEVGMGEFGTLAVREIEKRNPAICSTKPYIKWATKHNYGVNN